MAYIRQWAAAVKAYPHTVYVRLMHEFNATPYPWAYGVDHVNDRRSSTSRRFATWWKSFARRK